MYLKVKREYNIGEGGIIDIFLYAETNGNADFICVIENKLDAKFSDKTKNKLGQLCKYYGCFSKNTPFEIQINEEKIKITDNTDKKFVLTFIDGRVKDYICPKYIPIDHSDILICLANAIDNDNDNDNNISFFDEKIKNKDELITTELLPSLSGGYNLTENNKKIINEIINPKKTPNKKFNRKNKIELKKFLQSQSEDNCKFLIEQYIYYFERLIVFNDGYTHLVKYDKDYYFIWDICKKIREDDYYKNFYTELEKDPELKKSWIMVINLLNINNHQNTYALICRTCRLK